MSTFYSALFTGCISFAATNIDDIFVLAALFSQSTFANRNAYIVAGQYLGISTLIVLSIVGALGALIIPRAWMGHLGIVPVYMGIKMFFSRDEETPIYRNVLTDLNTYKVMAIVIGNGIDNVSVYIPLFMQRPWFYNGIILIFFLILTGVWCWIAYKIVHNPWIGRLIEKCGQLIIPIVLIVVGGYIMLEAGTFALWMKMVFWR
ncbi:MAG: cadmium resistance transporter [Alicyclobacillus herbarius]|uniref:cadmium resistance transporter n=1 Tax=Alicyclobacillus herbarius TaxID=122960 RepID=UPI0023559951|nr:cadmium resistance transporter [Alicyclobacillus herbarius]MCL6632383.1 cadmium resistance transporter [Alicyclobacillus herbarius]